MSSLGISSPTSNPNPFSLSFTAGWQALSDLASRAAVVVTEDMPVDPDQGWLNKLSSQLNHGTALWAVVGTATNTFILLCSFDQEVACVVWVAPFVCLI